MHPVCTDDRAVAFFEGHDRVVGFHTSRLSGTQRLGDDVGGRDDAGRAGRGREVARLLQGGVVVGELADAAASHDVGARVADVEGQPVGSLGGAQNHEAGQGGSRGAHRVVGGCESRDRGGGGVDGEDIELVFIKREDMMKFAFDESKVKGFGLIFAYLWWEKFKS